MALSIQIPYRGDQYLFQGISGAGQSIGDGIEQMATRLKQAKALRTMAVDGLGMDPDKVGNMSLEQVQGALQGAALKQSIAQHQQQMQFQQNQMQEQQQAISQHSALVNFARSFANGPQPTLPAPGFSDLQQAGGADWAGGGGAPALPQGAPVMPPSAPANPILSRMPPPESFNDRTLRALGQFPEAAASSQFDNTLNAMARGMRPEAVNGLVPFTAPGLGAGYINAHSGKTVYDLATEAAVAKARAAGKTGPVQKGDAPDIPQGGSLDPATDSKGREINGLFHVLDAKGNRVGTWMNKHTLNSAAAAVERAFGSGGAAAAPAAPVPTKADPFGLGIKVK